jgi:hypothetical protein
LGFTIDYVNLLCTVYKNILIYFCHQSEFLPDILKIAAQIGLFRLLYCKLITVLYKTNRALYYSIWIPGFVHSSVTVDGRKCVMIRGHSIVLWAVTLSDNLFIKLFS